MATMAVPTASAATQMSAVAVQSISFGSALSAVFDDVDSVVQNAITSANRLATEAIIRVGDELKLVIGDAADVYKGLLEQTADTVDATARSVLTQLQTLANDFRTATDSKLTEIEGKLPAVLTLIPFASQQNRLTSITPVCQVAEKAGTIVVKGIFPAVGAGYKDFDPELTLNGIACKYLSGTTTELFFERLPGVFPDAANVHAYTKVAGQLKSFWNAAWLSQVRVHKAEAIHKLTMTALPASPGKATVTWVRDVPGCTKESAVSQVFSLAGWPYAHQQDWHDEYYNIFPKEGWRVYTPVQPSITTVGEVGPGATTSVIQSLAEDKIVLRLSVNCKHGTKMGNISAYVGYTIHQDKVDQVRRTEVVEDLLYGNSRLLQPQSGERLQSITLDLNDGTHRELGAQPDISTSIHVRDAGNGQWQLDAVIPTQYT